MGGVLILKTLAAVALSVSSTFADPTFVPYNQFPDFSVNQVFGNVTDNGAWDKQAFSDAEKPSAFWVEGTIRVNGFGVSTLDLRSNTTAPQGHGFVTNEIKSLTLGKGEHVVNVVCGIDGGGIIYLELITNVIDKDGKYKSLSAGTSPKIATDDMKESAPKGKELSGYVVYEDKDNNIVGVSMIWTNKVEIK